MKLRFRFANAFVCLVLGVAPPLLDAQKAVDAENSFERIICIMPLTGTGTYNDPIRPVLAPSEKEARDSKIVEWSFELSDDGKSAIVEFVSMDKQALRKIASDVRVVKAFEKGQHTRAEIEVRKLRKGFDLNKAPRKP